MTKCLNKGMATSVRSENRTWLVPRLRTSHMPRASTCWLSFLRTCGSSWSTDIRKQNPPGTCYQEKEARQPREAHTLAGRRTGRHRLERRTRHFQTGGTDRQKKTAADTSVSEGPISRLCSHACSLLAGPWANTVNTCLKHAGRETEGLIRARLTNWTALTHHHLKLHCRVNYQPTIVK